MSEAAIELHVLFLKRLPTSWYILSTFVSPRKYTIRFLIVLRAYTSVVHLVLFMAYKPLILQAINDRRLASANFRQLPFQRVWLNS